MGEKINELEVKLATVTVKPYKRLVDGRIEDVSGYTRTVFYVSPMRVRAGDAVVLKGKPALVSTKVIRGDTVTINGRDIQSRALVSEDFGPGDEVGLIGDPYGEGGVGRKVADVTGEKVESLKRITQGKDPYGVARRKRRPKPGAKQPGVLKRMEENAKGAWSPPRVTEAPKQKKETVRQEIREAWSPPRITEAPKAGKKVTFRQNVEEAWSPLGKQPKPKKRKKKGVRAALRSIRAELKDFD